ncbi:MAG: twin-arginine translocase TatA/TatE family subunit [candidate division KSB1 bacterium]|nr:twin-arginine translocase TatA/TatE family subunit [candidate division KSB1 bacterium]MDZ7345530.1 twin-arginine translocase TatA/TatE family subunit [candidate division KSB1 bacterium]
MFGGLGPSELLVIFFVIILLFGGKKLPELAKGLGKGIREFKRAQQGEFDEPEEKKKSSDE